MDRKLISRNALCIAVCAVGLMPAVTAVGQSQAKLRGTWITTTGYSTGHVKDAATTNTTYQRLSTAGLNTTYIDAWRNGNTQFSSPTLNSAIGRTRDPALGSRDLLAETSVQARRQGMTNIAWFQYGFSAGFGNPSTGNPFSIYARDRGWLLTDSAGAYTNSSNNFAWMNPIIPEVRTFLKNIILESVRNYDIDGIQFDDRLAWPVQFGYDNTTRAAYLAETGRALPTNSSDANFVAWRAGKVTDFAKEVFAAVKAERPNLIVSVSPSTYPFSLTSYCTDWPTWTNTTVNVNGQNLPLFDEIIPQVYRSTASSFSSEWASEMSSTNSARLGDLAAGISINNSAGAPYNWATVNQPQVNDVNNDPVAGHVWWYSSGVLDSNEANITSLYSAQFASHHPDQTADWRKASVDAAKITSTSWQVTVPSGYVDSTNPLLGASFTPIYRIGNTWTALANVALYSGETTSITVPSTAVEVELIIDRRQPTFVPLPRWLLTGGGTWGTGANWYTAISPNSSGATAILGGSITAASTISVTSNVSVGLLRFDSTQAYTLSGAGRISLNTASGNALVDVLRGQHTVNTPVSFVRSVDVSVASGSSLAVGGQITAASGITLGKSGAGSLGLTGLYSSAGASGVNVQGGSLGVGGLRVGTLTVATGAAVELLPNSPASVLSSLTLSGTALLNVNNNDLLVTYTGTSPIAALISLLGSSQLQFDPDASGLPTMLAIAEAADLGLTEFAGVAIDDTTVIVKYTYLGDANLDGQVDALDYERIDLAIGNAGVFGTAQGDLNYDGFVDALDYEQVDLNIGNGVGSPLAAIEGGRFIPEPTALATLALLPLLASRRRRSAWRLEPVDGLHAADGLLGRTVCGVMARRPSTKRPILPMFSLHVAREWFSGPLR